jgi:hypothetical protein
LDLWLLVHLCYLEHLVVLYFQQVLVHLCFQPLLAPLYPLPVLLHLRLLVLLYYPLHLVTLVRPYYLEHQ